ncbi:NADH-quinone oxidoreductase subunit G [Roseospira marina]|uniref:NADH-quinone oxidoreductase n=1 Tax=Roseospira marina TaxID=140057 RepID=A0A5M6I967_9PROT|nr:NADH-quinone oxidoreductase subunit NuoG [Roseospira marina]KAA5604761.1 NADH-quinone oxidoreductase subunit G [Roseospira marina]MBB4313442.1 NADH-quinone oxidoreductase subunit G [Roseospira marina]MBB5086604.1 NADH-quinone oxidoreductase subunit G [Roseospira marina]
MPKLTIDGIEVDAEPGMTILQAADLVGIEIPRFCYHERLSIAGNCRMCLVEVKPGPPKPAASCAMPVAEGMQVWTQSDLAVKARKGVMEFLLINHPLDCPICDQGGECDLQDQAMAFGGDRSRFLEHKRAVTEKYLGPLVKTAMTRCIHCTRCVRFITEIAGIPELGMVGRGEHAEITSYVEKALSSELSGNIVDLCPVGALTSAPYAFHARPWELRKVESVDVFDAVGSNIRIDVRGNAVMRVLPRLNEDINEEWLADKSRHAIDGLRYQRLDQPYVREDGTLRPASWEEALRAVAGRLLAADADKVAALAGDMVDAEAMMVLKDLMGVIGSPHMDCRQDGAALDPEDRGSYLFNPTIAGIESADALLIVGSDPRWEAPILNARIRKRHLMGGFPIAVIGPRTDLTYPVEDLGNDPDVLDDMARGRHPFWRVLDDAERPMILVGMGALTRPDGANILASARHLADRVGAFKDDWNGLAILHTAAARVGGLELGFVPGPRGRDTAEIVAGAGRGEIDVVYLLGADEIDTAALGEAFVIYQGHHGDAGANRADAILPGAAYTEKNATYVNTEGRMQRTWLAVHPPGEAREDWKILRALSSAMGKPLSLNTLEDVRARLAEVSPTFAAGNEGGIVAAPPVRGALGGSGGRLERTPFTTPIGNYYRTDPISRASRTMAECTDVYINATGDGDSKRTGTDG